MNSFMNNLKSSMNYTLTQNGATTHKTTESDLLDLFALGGSYRNRDGIDCILLFKNAFEENPTYALKCLFYLRDCRGGLGERRFFRICLNWLAKEHPEAVIRNLEFIPFVGRWDDFYCLVDTPVEKEVFDFLKHQLALDIESTTPSLLAKWLKSENSSSQKTKLFARKTRDAFGMTSKQYRKILSHLRGKINIVERLISANKWNEIEFDKIPSKAGFIYKNAFAKHDYERYNAFINSKETKVNTNTLYPYEVVRAAIDSIYGDDINRNVINKYWDNLKDYFNGATLNAIAVVDTSGSMCGTPVPSSVRPIDVAISLGIYCAEKNSGPFTNKYISFASRPQLIEVKGIDFVDKVNRIYRTNLVDNTNIERVFDLLLNTAKKSKREDIPKKVIVISDMEFDYGCEERYSETLFDSIEEKWKLAGYKMPDLIFWNVNAMNNNIPMLGNRVSFVSGFSPTIFEAIMTDKNGYELMMEVLNGERYSRIN